jgi:hypothetical protein
VDLTNPDIYYDTRILLQKNLLHVARTVFVWRSTYFTALPCETTEGCQYRQNTRGLSFVGLFQVHSKSEDHGLKVRL